MFKQEPYLKYQEHLYTRNKENRMGGKTGGGKFKYHVLPEILMDCLEKHNWNKRKVSEELHIPYGCILDRCRKINRPKENLWQL